MYDKTSNRCRDIEFRSDQGLRCTAEAAVELHARRCLWPRAALAQILYRDMAIKNHHG